ncbi:serine/threonine-protein kinase [Nocardiopsis valliformis]|uniref:serine/threonine-protein kinase n=1 Tax=Nocardiopsis valliformis TaxID=239974 RepID=UPI000344C854|nr:serine/threonine-protein kinase [Nocardiopsis valliformis]
MEVEPLRTLCGRYQLHAELGHGGMGRVWRAHDAQLNRTVAVKEILLGPGLSEEERARVAARARREAQATAMGQHPNIVTVHDIVEDDGRPWIVMEYLSGCSLYSLIQRDGPHPAPEVASWGLDLLDALETAHTHGITHRDVKPENVMVTDSGRVVLTDFGIATIDDSVTLTQTGGVVGSPSYLAPERLAGNPAAPAADLWALGATLFHARTGVSPFQRPSLPATLHAVTTAEPPDLMGTGSLADAARGLLTKDPQHRLDAPGCRWLLRSATQDPDTTTVHPDGSVPVVPTARMSGAVPAQSPVPPTEHLTPVASTTPYPSPRSAPQPTPQPAFQAGAPGAYVPPPGTPAGGTPAGYGTPPARQGVSWPLVALTLGLAALLVTAGVVVIDPWNMRAPVTLGTQEEGDGVQGGGSEDGGDAAQEEPDAPAPAEEPQEEEEPEEAEEDEVPAQDGMTWTEDPSGFSILVPNGWSRRTENNSIYYNLPDADEEKVYLQIDTTPHPTDDQYQHVLEQDHTDTTTDRLAGYQLVQLEDVTGDTDFRSAADREFNWVKEGTDRHVLGRNITVAPGEHYTVLWASEADLWGDYDTWRSAALDSFDPP